MIISASRRCDIPAFAGDWFMERLRSGAVAVASPFRPGAARKVSLRRADVDAVVFWSRDVRPFLRHLPEIEGGGYPYYFLITLTGYTRLLEPAVPAVEDAAACFRELARRIGRRRVIWRYDPVLFTEALRRLRQAGVDAAAAAGSPQEQLELLERFVVIAARAGLEIQSCAEAAIAAGVTPGKCIDEALLNDLFNLNLAYRKDPAQRKLCLCQQSVDIGSYGTCGHGCLYCYACR